ncbi:lipopolysaccharide exporter [Ochrobactrum sp. 19YEA23]|uniref:oligosaccharide flippase family protein n=1 Tax=Ochrobactrum sp. 19YEA23 TaxID=3039854 RepID=UPI002478C040|nr:lipopolysaccharide exporter [Ochrobactrum sp. 19YEA23]
MKNHRRGFVIATLEQYAGLLCNFLTVVAVSRFLGPSETGMGVVGLSVAAIVFSLREFASAEFLIRIEKVEDRDIQTAFTFLMSVTAVLAVALFLARDYFAVTYHDPMLSLFLTITIIAAVIESVSLPVVALLRRDMAFGALARIRTAGSVCGAAVTIATAWWGFGHMCFAFGSLAAAAVTTAFAAALYPLARLLRPSLASIGTAWQFSMYLGSSAGLSKICETFPQLMLGRFMPAASVGIYNRANTLSGLPDRVFLSAIFTVAFPMLSAQVRAGVDIAQSYVRALSYISVVYWPAQMLLALLAYPAVHIVLGPDWYDATPIVVIMCLASVFWIPIILTYPLLMALGANRDAFVSNLISRVVTTVILCVAAYHGLMAVALSLFISTPFQMVISVVYVRKHVPFSYRMLGAELLRSGFVTLLTMAIPLAMVAAAGTLEVHWGMGIAIGFAGMASWLGAVLITRHPFASEITPVLGWALARVASRLGRFGRGRFPTSTPAE